MRFMWFFVNIPLLLGQKRYGTAFAVYCGMKVVQAQSESTNFIAPLGFLSALACTAGFSAGPFYRSEAMKCDDCGQTITEDAEYCTIEEKGKGVSPHIIYDPTTGETVNRLCHRCFVKRCPTHGKAICKL